MKFPDWKLSLVTSQGPDEWSPNIIAEAETSLATFGRGQVDAGTFVGNGKGLFFEVAPRMALRKASLR